MNEQLQSTLLEFLNKSGEALETAFVFTSEQVPDLIQQLLMFKLVESSLLTVLFLILFLLSMKYSLHLYKNRLVECKYSISGSKADGDRVCGSICAALLSSIMLWPAVAYLLETLKIWLAPKLYLIEYAADLVKPIVN